MTDENELPGRLIAISDIHGHSFALNALVDAIRPTTHDVIVTLGDYVNRGPDSKGVIECLLELGQICQLIPILGNHDEMFLDARQDSHANYRFMTSGGHNTILSYGSRSLDAVPDRHWDFLSSCRDLYTTKLFAFTHSNLCRYTPLANQLSSILRWTGIDEMEICCHESGKTAIVGHSTGKEIRDFGTCVCIDTGCGFGGLLTAYEPATKKQWQVTEKGERIQ